MVQEVFRTVAETVPLDVILELNGAFIDLTGATVTFSMLDERYWSGQSEMNPNTSLKVSAAACTLPNSSGADGTVRWSPVAANVNTVGRFCAQYTVTYAAGTVEKFPKDPRDFVIELSPSLDALTTE